MDYPLQMFKTKLYGIKMVVLRFIKANKKWIEISKDEERFPTDIYLDGKLRTCLDFYKDQQRKNNDVTIILSGDEGSGKSSLMGTIMEYMSDGEFEPTKEFIGSNYLEGLEIIENTKEGGRLGFDEGNSFFLATETVKREHRDLHKIFSIFRQKRLFVCIVLPSFFRLGSYFAMDRSTSLIKTYLVNGERGHFAFYGKKTKNKLYRLAKKTYNDNMFRPTFRGRFTKCQKLETEEYRKFKSVTLRTEIAKAKDKVKAVKSPATIEREYKERIIRENMDRSDTQLSEMLSMTRAGIWCIKKRIKQQEMVMSPIA